MKEKDKVGIQILIFTLLGIYNLLTLIKTDNVTFIIISSLLAFFTIFHAGNLFRIQKNIIKKEKKQNV